jgi:hypothetical protein
MIKRNYREKHPRSKLAWADRKNELGAVFANCCGLLKTVLLDTRQEVLLIMKHSFGSSLPKISWEFLLAL